LIEAIGEVVMKFLNESQRDRSMRMLAGIVLVAAGWILALNTLGVALLAIDGSMTMVLLNASLRTALRNVLVALPRPVTLLVFVGAASDTCGESQAPPAA
jgi:hypothetical protein